MTWTNIRSIQSSDQNVMKYVFEKDNAIAESVLYKYPTYEERTVICCSTQSGCPVGCRFCGAGDAFVRSLTHSEIVGQVTHLMRDRKIDARKVKRMQIMFMSMGEPLLNVRELAVAISILEGMYPEAKLLISTSAPRIDYQGVRVMSARHKNVGLQFSVHESTDEARNKLIPFEAKLSLKEIAEQGELWHEATGRRPFFNYCAHANNTSDDDADRLLDLFAPEIWECTVSVVCERDESVAAANVRQRELASTFMSKMVDRGFNTRMFDPAGQDDIGGGCGQLWFVQKWMQDNPQLARKSVGRGLPIIHAPR